MSLLDLIFPKTCVSCGKVGKYLCTSCLKKVEFIDHQICPVCTKPSISGITHPRCETKLSLDGLYSFVYFTPPVPQALYQFKYKFVKEFSEGLVGSLKLDLPSLFSDFYLIATPLHENRQNWRGFNQVEELAKIMAAKFNLGYKDEILVRKKPTKSQVGLSRKKRAENVRGAFGCIDRDFVVGKKLLLFDDVWTSGATLRNCATVLKRAGADVVWGITFARSR